MFIRMDSTKRTCTHTHKHIPMCAYQTVDIVQIFGIKIIEYIHSTVNFKSFNSERLYRKTDLKAI